MMKLAAAFLLSFRVALSGSLATAPVFLCTCLTTPSVWGAEGPKGAGPATVQNPRPETDLTTVIITPEAKARLGIALVAAEMKIVPRSRTFGGDVILPLGEVDAKPSIHDLYPGMTPAEFIRLAELQAESGSKVAQAKVRVDSARAAFARAEQLARERAGTEKALDEAQAALSLAEAELAGAQAQRDLLGAPIFDSFMSRDLWVRVPVYVGELQRLALDAPARIGGLADSPGASAIEGTPVKAPHSVTAGLISVDLYYSFAKPDGELLRPGQRVGVTIPLRGSEQSLVVPWSAVLYDINGGTWVYEETAPETYRRIRVEVQAVNKGEAVLQRGPEPGALIVATGATELFGTEFGVGK